MTQSEIRLEPLGVGTLLDLLFRLYSQNLALVVGIAALVQVPIGVLNYFLGVYGDPVDPGLAALPVALLSLVAYGLMQGATTHAISSCYLGESITVGQAYGRVRGRLTSIVIASLIFGLLIGVGFVLLIIPGCYWLATYILVIPAIALEDLGVSAGARRSRELARGLRWKILGVMILVFLLSFVAQVPVNLFPVGMPQAVASIVVSLVIAPIQIIAATLLYYDARIRKEAFDLVKLSESFSGGGGGGADPRPGPDPAP